MVSASDANSPDYESSLESLCRAYWYPLYAYVRRQGRSPHDAQDLTQEFFACLLRKNYLQSVDREKGKFRTFLIMAFQRFLANEWDRHRAQKRGGGQPILSLNTEEAERKYLNEPSASQTPDQVFDRRWALTILDRTMASLRAGFTGAGKTSEFEQLKLFLTAADAAPSCVELAQKLGISEGAARVAVHRIRKRFRETFRAEISQVVTTEEAIDEEIRYLRSVLST